MFAHLIFLFVRYFQGLFTDIPFTSNEKSFSLLMAILWKKCSSRECLFQKSYFMQSLISEYFNTQMIATEIKKKINLT